MLAGPLLADEARKAGVVYSLAYGDQPALTSEMVDWARATGFRVVAAGKGTKYLPAYHDVTPDGGLGPLRPYGRAGAVGGINPQMFNSFLDGTKSAIEMAAIANATGLEVPPAACFPALRRRRPAAHHAAARAAACWSGRASSKSSPRWSATAGRCSVICAGASTSFWKRRTTIRGLLQAIRAADRCERPLRRDVQALSSDRAGTQHLDPVRRAARRADRPAARFPRRCRLSRQARPARRRNAGRRGRLYRMGQTHAGRGSLAAGALPMASHTGSS